MKVRFAALVALMAPCAFSAPAEIGSSIDTAPFVSYDDAPATVDADDPAIWVHPERPADSLVIGTLKDAGLVVYDLRGKVAPVHRSAEPADRSSAGSADAGRREPRITQPVYAKAKAQPSAASTTWTSPTA